MYNFNVNMNDYARTQPYIQNSEDEKRCQSIHIKSDMTSLDTNKPKRVRRKTSSS